MGNGRRRLPSGCDRTRQNRNVACAIRRRHDRRPRPCHLPDSRQERSSRRPCGRSLFRYVSNNHTGLEGCFQFVFDNPYAGAPSVDKPTVSPCAGSFESGDPSNDYKFSWAGSQTDVGDKWSEWLSPLGPLSGLFHTNHPVIRAMIEINPVQPGPKPSDSGFKADLPPAPELITRPVSGSVRKLGSAVGSKANPPRGFAAISRSPHPHDAEYLPRAGSISSFRIPKRLSMSTTRLVTS